MTLEQALNDKIGRKQVIAVIAIICLDGNPGYQVAVALVAIAVQAVLDWKRPRNRESKGTSKGNKT